MASWTDYTIAKYFGGKHRESTDERLRRMKERTREARLEVTDRVNQLEDDLGRAVLLIQALAETCIRKGVLSRDQLAEMTHEVDLWDGKIDGKLDPDTLRPPEERGPKQTLSPEEPLRRLEEES